MVGSGMGFSVCSTWCVGGESLNDEKKREARRLGELERLEGAWSGGRQDDSYWADVCE